MAEDLKTFARVDVVALAIGRIFRQGKEGREATASIIRHVCGLDESSSATGRFARFTAGFLREKIPALSQLDTTLLTSWLGRVRDDQVPEVLEIWLRQESGRLKLPDNIEIPSLATSEPPDKKRLALLRHAFYTPKA
jgi:hypothetical protein